MPKTKTSFTCACGKTPVPMQGPGRTRFVCPMEDLMAVCPECEHFAHHRREEYVPADAKPHCDVHDVDLVPEW
jgi:hypothetical protein